MIHPVDNLRDYAVGELPAARQPELEQHINACEDCAAELDRLRITTAALRMLPDREIPQRIAFVSDKVFEPSPVSRFFGGFWNSAARLGFASACVLAAALVVSAYHRPAEVRTIVQTANVDVSKRIDVSKQVDVSRQIDDAVIKAVAQVKADDARMIETVNRKQAQEYQARMIAVEESFTVMQKRLHSALLASNEMRGAGDGQ